MSFAARTLAFVESIAFSHTERQDLLHHIIKYALQIHGLERSTVLRKYAFKIDILPEVMHFKAQYLDVSSYIHRQLWKDVLHYLQGSTTENTDIAFCMRYLDAADVAVLKGQSVNEDNSVDKLDLDEWAKGKNILKWVKKKLYKLKFISTYDPGFDLEDFGQELACEAIRVINTYQRMNHSDKYADEPIEDRLDKYLEGALANKVGSLIEYYTSLSRRRMVSTNDDLYKNLKAVKKSLGSARKKGEDVSAQKAKVRELTSQIQNTESDYYSVTVAIEPSEDIESEDIHIESHHNATDIEETMNNLLWIESFRENISDPRDQEYINLILDSGAAKEFQGWLDDKGYKADTFTANHRLACKYVMAKDKRGGYNSKLPRWNKKNLTENPEVLRMLA